MPGYADDINKMIRRGFASEDSLCYRYERKFDECLNKYFGHISGRVNEYIDDSDKDIQHRQEDLMNTEEKRRLAQCYSSMESWLMDFLAKEESIIVFPEAKEVWTMKSITDIHGNKKEKIRTICFDYFKELERNGTSMDEQVNNIQTYYEKIKSLTKPFLPKLLRKLIHIIISVAIFLAAWKGFELHEAGEVPFLQGMSLTSILLEFTMFRLCYYF